MSQTIKTNIKFSKGLDGIDSRIYGLVTKINGSWRGCRTTDECKKKIVFVDTALIDRIVPNRLYACSLKQMKSEQGFIAVSAQPVTFKARINTYIKGDKYQVTVEFGNKKLIYNPASTKSRYNNIKMIADNIRGRHDIQNPINVAEDFLDSACIVKHLFETNVRG